MSPLPATFLSFLLYALLVQAQSIDIVTIARLAFPHLAAEARQFGLFAAEYHRNYATKDEVLTRFAIFAENLKKIKRYNEEAQSLTTYGITQFADWSWVEFSSKMLLKAKPSLNISMIPQRGMRPQTKRPDSVDWRTSNIVTGVKNQGGCGSSWAFATTAVVESMNAKAGRGLVELSEQQMVDCIESGCNGGVIQNAFAYARDHGLPQLSDYPYTAQHGLCHEAQIRAKLRQVYTLPKNEGSIADSVASRGPAAVGFKVGPSLQHYTGGILMSTDCEQNNYWHGLSVIGYGVDGGSPFWLFKNQWGTGWGERGFARVRRGSNWCRVTEMAVAGDA